MIILQLTVTNIPAKNMLHSYVVLHFHIDEAIRRSGVENRIDTELIGNFSLQPHVDIHYSDVDC